MRQRIQNDGNGNYIIPKRHVQFSAALGVVLSIIALASFVWAASGNFYVREVRRELKDDCERILANQSNIDELKKIWLSWRKSTSGTSPRSTPSWTCCSAISGWNRRGLIDEAVLAGPGLQRARCS